MSRPRYEIRTPWRWVDEWEQTDSEGREYVIVREATDLVELPLGHVWDDGAWRVRAVKWGGPNRPRTKTYKGELAWADSRRLFDDIVNGLRYQPPWG